MLNRLLEIKDDEESGGHVEIEVTESDYVKKFGTHMEEYFKEVTAIREETRNLKTNIDKLTQEHNQYLSSTTASQNRAVKQRIGRLVEDTRDHVKALKQKLDKMNENTKKIKEEKNDCAEVRIREQQHYYLMKEFVAMLQQYQKIQDQFKEDSEERMVRQIKIAKADVTDDEIEQMLQQKEMNVFKAVLTGTQKSTIEAVHAEVLETYNDVKELAEQFRELHEMFVDFAALVAEQDELIDLVSCNVERSSNWVEKGVDNLKDARTYQSRGRSTLCIILIVLLVIFAVLIVVAGLIGGAIGAYFGITKKAI